jgi:hypothetical protein
LEVEIGELEFKASLGKTLVISYQKMRQVWRFMPVVSATWEAGVGGLRSETSPGKKWEPYLKNNLKTNKRTMGVDQIIEYLLTKCEALSSIPNTTEKRKLKTTRKHKIKKIHLLSLYI